MCPWRATPSAAGTYTVVASFAGSADYASAASSNANFTIAQATPTVTVSDPGGTYNGTSTFPATALVNGAATLESVSTTLTYYDGRRPPVHPWQEHQDAAGTYTVVANFGGSADYTSATSNATFTIGRATPTVTVSDLGGTFSGGAFPGTGLVNGAATLETVDTTLT